MGASRAASIWFALLGLLALGALGGCTAYETAYVQSFWMRATPTAIEANGGRALIEIYTPGDATLTYVVQVTSTLGTVEPATIERVPGTRWVQTTLTADGRPGVARVTAAYGAERVWVDVEILGDSAAASR